MRDAICKLQFVRCNLQDALLPYCLIAVAISQWCNIAISQCNNVYIAVCVSSHSCGSLEMGRPSLAEVIKDSEDFLYYSGFYILFSVCSDIVYFG